MIALLLDGKSTLVADLAPPTRRKGEALVSMSLAGICDTDLQLARGYMGFRGVLGHEAVGVVLDADDSRWIGRRVVADINAGCGACEDCVLRDGHHCPTRTVLGIVGREGVFAERFVVPERCLVAVPDSVDDERAVFAEPLAAALHVLDDAVGARDAIVVGDGKLGLLVALALVGAGLEVTLVGHHEAKLALARAAGARALLEDDLAVAGLRSGLVVEATGTGAGLGRAISLARPRATLVLKTTIAARHDVDLSRIVVDELRVVGSRCGDLGRAMRALEAGDVDPRPLVAARYPLARADEALARAGVRGALKILVEGAPS